MTEQIGLATRPLRAPRWRAVAVLVVVMILGAPAATAQQKAGPQSFQTPEAAVDALIAATRDNDERRLLAIFGPESRSVLGSGDPVRDKADRAAAVAAYDAGHRIDREGDKATLVIGKEDWPFAIPIVKRGETWVFDIKAGADELLSRRIGRNELDTIKTCEAYVDAQFDYAEKDRNDDGFREYAQRFLSSPGKHDGLFWEERAGEEESPLGPLMVSARAEGYTGDPKKDQRTPYHGYYFRILKGQGKNAAGGAYSYLAKGHMIGGFALVAYPAEYGRSGIMTFIVNQTGVVFQKDLGANTAKTAGAMALFDPDGTWSKAE